MLTVDRVAGAALALLALGVLFESRQLPLGTLHSPGPAYLPVILALGLLLLGSALLVRGGKADHVVAVNWRDWRHSAAILGSCAFGALGLERLGYRLTLGLMLVFLVGVVERKHIMTTVILAAALAAGSYYLFDTLLRVPLPRGPWSL